MNTKGQGQKPKRLRSDALIEAFRDLGTDTAKGLGHDFLANIPKDVFAQTGLQPPTQPDRQLSSESAYFEEQEAFLRRRLGQTEVVRHEEKLVFTAKQRETQTKIVALVEEIKKLGLAVQKMEKQVEITAFQAPVNPGVYHENFFEKIISFMRSLSRKIEDGADWMAAFNSKGKKRSHYWGQVQKSGTKFMLSQERYMATQAG